MTDLRYAFRGLLNSPGFSAVAVLSLALGIGANALIFGLVDGLVLHPIRDSASGFAQLNESLIPNP